MCARVARKELLYGDCYAHIISRSIRKLKIFRDDEDYCALKNLLLIEKRRSNFRVVHYCFMQTHFHLAVKISDVTEFSKSLARVKSRYVGVFHAKYRLSGPIWRERFKSLLIENDGYLLACGRYIESNPLKAGMIERIEDWKFSSYRFYHQNIKDELVDGYEDLASVQYPKDWNKLNEVDFEQGSLVGSAFFKFQFFEARKRA